MRARITSQGQITVPKEVRDELGARPGDDIEFEPRGDAYLIRRRPRLDVLSFAGVAQDAVERLPATAEELDALIGDVVIAQVLERQRGLASRSRAKRQL